MAEGGDGVGGTVGTSARNPLARRGSSAELLLWVSSNQQGSGGEKAGYSRDSQQ